MSGLFAILWFIILLIPPITVGLALLVIFLKLFMLFWQGLMIVVDVLISWVDYHPHFQEARIEKASKLYYN